MSENVFEVDNLSLYYLGRFGDKTPPWCPALWACASRLSIRKATVTCA